jgi:apolipoprotein N-acyltransferase
MPVNETSRDILPGEGLSDMSALLEFSRKGALSHPKGELVVLPELPCGYSCTPEADRDMPRLVANTGMAVMIPCAAVADPAKPLYYNSVAYTDKSGVMGEQYCKNILVPFGEYIPLERRFPLLRRLFPGVMPFVPGEKVVLYGLGKGRQGIPALCFEAVFSGHVRRFVEQGGNVLINMVDDAWFGTRPASLTHLSLAMYRSVEYRIPMVRITNSGVGAFVQPTGEIAAGTKTGMFQCAVTGTELFIPLHRSLYFRIGDAFLYVLLLVLGVDVVLRWRRGKMGADKAG